MIATQHARATDRFALKIAAILGVQLALAADAQAVGRLGHSAMYNACSAVKKLLYWIRPRPALNRTHPEC